MAEMKGRPARRRTTRQVGITLPHELIPQFKKLGGSAWLRRLLEAGAMGNWPHELTLLLAPDVLGEQVAFANRQFFTDDMETSFGIKDAMIEDYEMTVLTFDKMDGNDAIYHDGYDLWRVFPSDNGRHTVTQI